MAREDGIRASREILSIMKGMPVNEGISVLVFVLSSIYSIHEITKPIEDCADEIKEEFIKNFNKINDGVNLSEKVNNPINEPKDKLREGFGKVYERMCRELKLIIDNEPWEPSMKAIEVILAYYIGLNNPNNFEDKIKIMAEDIIDTIRETIYIRKMIPDYFDKINRSAHDR